jgi:hypothetical protein
MLAARRGQALPDGSFPIRNRSELSDAIQALGRAKDQARVKRTSSSGRVRWVR